MKPQPTLTRIAFALLWILVFSMPSEKAIEIAGIGTLSKLTGAVAMAAGVLAIAWRRRLRKLAPVHVALVAFVLWSACSYCWSLDPDLTLERVKTYLQLLALAWLIWELCPGETHVKSLLEAYVLGTFVPVASTLARYASGTQTYYERFASQGFDPNDLALTLALSLPMSYYLALSRQGARRWIYRFQLLAAAGTILLTASRGGTLAMLAASTLVLWTLPALARTQRWMVAGTAAAAVIGAALLVPASSWQRIATVFSEATAGTLNSRTVIWKAGWEAFGQAPFQGVGAGAYPETVVPVLGRPWGFLAVAHNSFLSVLAETGLIGLGVLLCTLTLLLKTAARLEWLESRFYLTLLAVWALGVFSLTWEYRKPTWLIFGLVAARGGVPGRVPRPLPAYHLEEVVA